MRMHYVWISCRSNRSGDFNLRSIKNHKKYINPLDKAGLIAYINTCNIKTKRNTYACISQMVIYPEVRTS
jgi:hypothetical protein